jgi:hypothetical protein
VKCGCKLKEEALDRAVRRTRFGIGFVPGVRLRDGDDAFVAYARTAFTLVPVVEPPNITISYFYTFPFIGYFSLYTSWAFLVNVFFRRELRCSVLLRSESW